MKKENLKTIDGLTRKIESIEKQLQVECSKCDGTGKPRTKTGKPPQDKSGNAKCATCYGTGLKGSVINIIEDNIISIKKDIKRLTLLTTADLPTVFLPMPRPLFKTRAIVLRFLNVTYDP